APDQARTPLPPDSLCRDTNHRSRRRNLQTGSRENAPDTCCYLFDLRFRDSQTTREVESAARQALGYRIALAGKQPSPPEHRLLVHGPEEWPGFDTQRAQPPHGFFRIEPYPFLEQQ